MSGRRPTSNTPAVITSAAIESGGIESAVLLHALEQPQSLLQMPVETFEHLVDDFTAQGAPFMAALKRGSGILAWAARHHLPDTHYGAWLHRFATTLGVSDDSVLRWRDRAINELGLPVAAVTVERSRARIAGARKAGAAPATRSPAVTEAVTVLAPAVVGSSTPPARGLVEQLLELSPEDLAESGSTEELRAIKGLIEAALAEQQRVALRARLAQRDRRQRTKVG